jgi:hypothetical protein
MSSRAVYFSFRMSSVQLPVICGRRYLACPAAAAHTADPSMAARSRQRASPCLSAQDSESFLSLPGCPSTGRRARVYVCALISAAATDYCFTSYARKLVSEHAGRFIFAVPCGFSSERGFHSKRNTDWSTY